MICIQKPDGFVGSKLVAVLRARGLHHCSMADRARRPSGPSVYLLNRWNSVPSSTTGSARAEVTASLLPLLELLDESDWNDVVHVVFLSSAGAVYGPASGLADEAACPSPTSNYGAGKLAAEAFLKVAAARHRFPLTILRPSNLYGPGQPWRPGFGIVPAIHAALNGGAPVQIWPGADVRKDYLYIDDFIDALVCVLRGVPPTSGHVRVFNVASGHCANVHELLSLSARVRGGDVSALEPAGGHGNKDCIVAPDARRFRDWFGWQPRYDLGMGLKATFDWLDGRAP
jgi:UDP-glucose 4-epimerase